MILSQSTLLWRHRGIAHGPRPRITSARYIESLLYQVKTTDLSALAAPALALFAVTIVATLPATKRTVAYQQRPASDVHVPLTTIIGRRVSGLTSHNAVSRPLVVFREGQAGTCTSSDDSLGDENAFSGPSVSRT
jgi:hypothetical protein